VDLGKPRWISAKHRWISANPNLENLWLSGEHNRGESRDICYPCFGRAEQRRKWSFGRAEQRGKWSFGRAEEKMK
jgi:hypothetical protein